ncbi:MAG: ATP-grasp domain-containing protein, partial [Halobacteriovoraceae bacterium]|nr:ATP-grasp domain-containing protein [Halobacteriovoraceae bacterium]
MKRILICNRGEIAIRVAKAIRELEHTAIGFWTDNELEPPHLEYCDEWVHLKGDNNTDTYLNMDQILELVAEHKVDAVHPGYGFLSENTVFAQRLEEKGVLFIGPNSNAIEKMGDKAISKQMAKDAGVPVVPGSTGEVDSAEDAKKIAKDIKYPVLLKAVAGGGGKGMRVCIDDAELEKNFDAVRREALSSFGNAGVLVEKFIVNPHHIEVQIIADKKGNIYHCFERECSVQRRHQKITEEAPSPFVGDDEALRSDLCQTAIKLAQAVDYDSAGTVEFIMGEDRSFYFLEMNTRIQVEHPITEMITGVDLVVSMIQAALGENLDISSQADITRNGHAIECRICAEDPVTMLPAPGKVVAFEHTFPQGVRFDHCIYNGFEVKPDFDPMIGKLIMWGHNRKVALRKAKNAIKNLQIDGVKTNIHLHEIIIQEKNFVDGIYTTNYIPEFQPQSRVESLVNENALYKKAISIELLG